VALSNGLKSMVAQYGEAVTFAGDPALQLSQKLRSTWPVANP